jgi:UDP-glucuronate decarboxylase
VKNHIICVRRNGKAVWCGNCYDESKRLGETLVQIYHEYYGVQGKIIRPFNVYGPGMQKTDYRVLPNFAAKVLEKKSLQVYGTGNQTRTFCYVTDAIRGFLQVLVNGVPGEPYNIGNPTPEVSVIDLVKEIEIALDRKIEYDVVSHPDSYPADEPNRRCPDITKAQNQIGYNPKVSLHEGLIRFFKWAEKAYVE